MAVYQLRSLVFLDARMHNETTYSSANINQHFQRKDLEFYFTTLKFAWERQTNFMSVLSQIECTENKILQTKKVPYWLKLGSINHSAETGFRGTLPFTQRLLTTNFCLPSQLHHEM